MRLDMVDITIVMDVSGSMGSCKDAAQNGINEFVKKQREHKGKTLLTMVEFGSDVEVPFDAVDLHLFPEYKLVPRGSTALWDGVGSAITRTANRLSKIPDTHKPGLVIFLILTDGEENSSTRYTDSILKGMIQQYRDNDNWQFMFLGAGPYAYGQASHMGIDVNSAAQYSTVRTFAAFVGASGNINRMRLAMAKGQKITSAYSEEERKKMR